jgi:hypothetical protein
MEKLLNKMDNLAGEDDDSEEQEMPAELMMAMQGEEINDCEECGKELSENRIIKKVGGTEYHFCSQECVVAFLSHFG